MAVKSATNSSTRHARSRSEWGSLGFVLAMTVALHVGTLRNPFFADDYLFLEQSRGRSIVETLASPDPLGNFFRPVSRQIYFWLLTRAGGESPVLFHMVGLVLFLSSVVLFYLIARRFIGGAGATFAAAFVALHYAADVPLRWASGGQDLLASLFATLAIYLHITGRRVLAPIALLFGLLSKEAVAAAALVAIIADHERGESWLASARRGWGLVLVTFAWGIWWMSSLGSRAVAGHSFSFEPGSAAAALVHLVQTAMGWEFRLEGNPVGHWRWFAFVPAIVAAAALLWLGPRSRREAELPEARLSGIRTGAAWAILASLPCILVMPIWSAYFYLWAMFGVALLLASLTVALSAGLRALALGVLVYFSANARALDEFETSNSAWSPQSHVNRYYVDRSLGTIRSFLEQMRAARPSLPPRSTVFFANLPLASGWQAGDGALLRWAYRDSSLRSYYLMQFTKERAERGPVFFFAAEGGSLKDKSEDLELLPSFALSMLVNEHTRPAVEVLDMAVARSPENLVLYYWRGLARWCLGDTTAARDDLRRAGLSPSREVPAEARRLVDTAPAGSPLRIMALMKLRKQAALSVWVNAELAASLLATGRVDEAAVEAYAYRVFAPDEPDAWKKWGSVQIAKQQLQAALASFERSVILSSGRGQHDAVAEQVVEELRRRIHGDLAHRALRSPTSR